MLNAESIQKSLKTFDFTTTYAILMNLTTDIYLDKIFELETSWGVFHKVYEDINKKALKMSQKINFLTIS